MSHYLSQRWLISRRQVLRGVGASLALPLLQAMTPLRAASAGALPKAKRAVFIYVPNGVNGMTWRVTQAGQDYEFSRALKSLEPHRKDLTIFSGLHHPNALGLAHAAQNVWLTGAKGDQGTGQSYDQSVSVDQIISETMSAFTRIPSLELSVKEGMGKPTKSNSLAFTRDGSPLPAEASPKRVFDRLFGPEDPGGIGEKRRMLHRKQSIVDAVLDDAKSFRQSLGAEDFIKLDEYLQSVRDVEQRVQRLDKWLDAPKPHVRDDEAARFAKDVPQTDTGEYYRTMFDLMVLALRTDMTRVVTFVTGLENSVLPIPKLGIGKTRHALSHHNGNPDDLEALTQADEFIVQQYAYFLDRLKQEREEGESLLDSTISLIGSALSYGHSHNNADLPIVLAGGRGLGLKHGQHIDYNLPKIGRYTLDYDEWRRISAKPLDDRARFSNLLLTVMQTMDVHAETFVDSLGPISDIL